MDIITDAAMAAKMQSMRVLKFSVVMGFASGD
jgi:hypothetical protein